MTDAEFQELREAALAYLEETKEEGLRKLLTQLLELHDRQHVQLAGVRAGLALILREIH